ncbi:MAG: hypothetical protein ACLFPJ_03815 [Candidatus Woesearchaeota archaeon]
MTLTPLTPSWFFGYNVALELVFGVITLIVSLYALKIYRTINLNHIKYLSLSFAFISLSYIIKSIFNFLIIFKINENILGIVKIQSIVFFDAIGLYAHIFFMTLGLVTLTFMTFKSKKTRILWLMLVTSLFAIFLNINTWFMFFLFSTTYLLFLSLHFISNYLQNRQKKILLIALAFLFLLFGNFHLLISINHQLSYAIGPLLEFVAYLLILINLYMVKKK